MTTVCILEVGLTPPSISDGHGDFPAMIRRWLHPHMPDARFASVSVIRGEPLPEKPSAFDAYVITGSEHSVYERLPWMGELKTFIRAAAEEHVPIFGVCFGHQIMAEAYGGRVEKAREGWQCGVYEYRILPNTLLSGVKALPVLALHQDQVVALPAGTTLIGGCETSPYAFLKYGETAASIQAHPEFSGETVKAYLDLAKLGVLIEDATSGAEALVGVPRDCTVAKGVAQLFAVVTKAR